MMRPVPPEGRVTVPVPRLASLLVATIPAETVKPPVKVLIPFKLSVLPPTLVSRPEPETTPVKVRSEPLVFMTVGALSKALLPIEDARFVEIKVPPAMTRSRVNEKLEVPFKRSVAPVFTVMVALFVFARTPARREVVEPATSRVPPLMTRLPRLTSAFARAIQLLPVLVSVYSLRVNVALVGPRKSQRCVPPMEASPERTRAWTALIWLKPPLLTMAPLPPTPAPAIVTMRLPKLRALAVREPPKSRVAPEATVTASPTLPSEKLSRMTSVPPLMRVPPL